MKILLLDIEYNGSPVSIFDDGFVLVIGKRGHYLSQWINSNGYLTCKLNNKHTLIHRIVASIIPNPLNLSDVNHKDGNKLNNRIENLEWCSRSDNIWHSLSTGLHCNPCKPVVAVNRSNGDGWWFRSTSEARLFGFTQANVCQCLRGKRSSCKNHEWEYA